MYQPCSRRNSIQRLIYLLVTIPMFGSCERKESSAKKVQPNNLIDPCDDLTGLTEGEGKTRTGLGYVKKSPLANMQCNNCNLWLPPGTDQECGRCLLFKGPVYPVGYCTNWAAKPG